jgi:hypothetical protein
MNDYWLDWKRIEQDLFGIGKKRKKPVRKKRKGKK